MPPLPPLCRPAQITMVADDGGGVFNGMSHAGTYLYLRNVGPKACSLPAYPLVRLLDRRGHVLPAARRDAAAARPVTVTAGARAQLSLRWVSGPVFAQSRCLVVTRVAVGMGAGAVSARVAARACGAAGAPIRFDQTVLKPIADYPAE